MTDHPHNSPASTSARSSAATGPDRRQFLRLLGAGAAGAGAITAGARLFSGGDAPSTASNPSAAMQRAAFASDTVVTTTPNTPAAAGRGSPERTLVVIELEGGNDGLSTLIPAADPAYRRMRANSGHDPAEVIDIGAGLGLHPQLAGLHQRGLAVVAGVGTENPDGSHFEMARRWAQGDSAGTGTHDSGFLGRCCDQLRRDELVSGVSLGWGSVPNLLADQAVTMSLPDPDGFDLMTRRDLWSSELRDGMRLMTDTEDRAATTIATARAGLRDALEFGGLVADMPSTSDGYPSDEFANRLAIASRVIRSGAGVRILHVPLGGFDTHDDHRWSHDELMRRLDEGLSAFLDDVAAAGLADDVLVATISEFGRRPQENGSGTDHGAASVALVAGPVRPGVHGDPSPLDDLDPDENLRATVDLHDYYATLAESWLGLDARDLLDGRPRPLQGVLA